MGEVVRKGRQQPRKDETMTIDLTEPERELIAGILHERLGEFRAEVRHARVSEYRDRLKDREQMLRDVIEKFEARSPVST
jgi:hypothetical protein